MNVGIVGIGFMGMIHYLAWQKVKHARVAAICTRDRKKLRGDWRGIKGNFGPKGEVMDLVGIEKYERWEELIEDSSIDVVDVCLPPSMHAKVTIAALRAGKHVVCEKPIALEVADAQAMVKAAVAAKRQLFIAQVLPFFPEYAYAYKLIRSGKYGRMLGGHFKRMISDPLWLKDFYDPQGAGGPVVDLHIHDAHFIRLLCGMPTSLFSTGRTRGEVVEYINTQFMYPDGGPTVTATSGVVYQQGREFTHGFEIHLEKATLQYEFATVFGEPPIHIPLTVYASGKKVLKPELPAVDAFVTELSEVERSVRVGDSSPLLAGDLASDALLLCHREQQSVRSGRIVKV